MIGHPARNGPLRRLLMQLSRRYKFRRICKALEIKPFGWQQDFALEPYPPRIPAWLRGGRCNGKTTAVILRLLLLPVNAPKEPALRILREDPGLAHWEGYRVHWFSQEYRRCYVACIQAEIPVPFFDIERLAAYAADPTSILGRTP